MTECDSIHEKELCVDEKDCGWCIESEECGYYDPCKQDIYGTPYYQDVLCFVVDADVTIRRCNLDDDDDGLGTGAIVAIVFSVLITIALFVWASIKFRHSRLLPLYWCKLFWKHATLDSSESSGRYNAVGDTGNWNEAMSGGVEYARDGDSDADDVDMLLGDGDSDLEASSEGSGEGFPL